MPSLEQISLPVKEEMIKFEKHFRNSMKSNVPLLNIITNYILRRKGKQMRPLFVFLSAAMHGKPTESTYTAASLIELLHTASLIHDDVVDESFERRGFFSIQALWKTKISVLVGDYLLAKGLLLSVEKKEYGLLNIVSEAVREMSEGELIQLQKSRKLNLSESDYFEIIRKKTASLIASCTACGALSSGVEEEVVLQMKQFGEYVGIAFQIKDDLLDYEQKSISGKPAGNDIQEKKFTLPLIYALKNANNVERKHILSLIKHHNKNSKKVAEIIDFVVSHGGINYANAQMEGYKDKALQIISEFKETEASNSLKALVEFTISRNK